MEKIKRNEKEIAFISLPSSVANLSLPDPDLLEFYRNLEKRVYWIDSEIDSYSLDLVKYIMTWNMQDKNIPVEERTPIRLIFFSPGGSLSVYRTISEIIRLSKTPIIGINIGEAYSAAAMIFCSCHKKYMIKGSSLLFHKGSCGNLGGSYEEVYSFMIEYEKQVGEMVDFIKSVSNYTDEEVEDRVRSDWYISAEEALEHKICDKIVDDIEEIL